MAGLKTKPEYNGLAEAVSLGIALLKKAKQNTWPELVQAMGEGNLLVVKAFKAVDLTDAQLDTVNMWQQVLNLVKVNPAVIPVICPACGHYVLTGDTAPSRCMVTAGCEGKPFKVASATGNTAPKAPPASKTATPAAGPELANKATRTPAKEASVTKSAQRSDRMVDFMPDDVPEPQPVAEAEPNPGPTIESAAASAPESQTAVLDMVIVPDDEDPFT